MLSIGIAMSKKPQKKLEENKSKRQYIQYSPDFIEKMIEYFSIEPTRIDPRTLVDKKGVPSIVQATVANKMPEFYGFADSIGCCDKSLRNWAKEYPEFKEAVELCKMKTASFINYLACNGFWNPQYAMFLAPNYTNMVNSSKVENTIKGQITTVQRKVINLPLKKTEGEPVG